MIFFSRFGFTRFQLSFQCFLHARCDGTMEPSISQHKEFVESEVALVTVSKGRHIFASKIIFLTCFFFSVFFHLSLQIQLEESQVQEKDRSRPGRSFWLLTLLTLQVADAHRGMIG